jgi:hypothetical protein
MISAAYLFVVRAVDLCAIFAAYVKAPCDKAFGGSSLDSQQKG